MHARAKHGAWQVNVTGFFTSEYDKIAGVDEEQSSYYFSASSNKIIDKLAP